MNVSTGIDWSKLSDDTVVGLVLIPIRTEIELRRLYNSGLLRLEVYKEIGSYLAGTGEGVPAPHGAEKYKLDFLELSARAHRALEDRGLETLGDLADLSKLQLQMQHGVGPKTVQEIEKHLALYGLALKE
jgi:hypothetical protein